MTPFFTLALALAMPIASMAAAVAKPFDLETGEPQDNVSIENEGIVGRDPASAAEFPYIVSLSSKSNSHFCAGVLFNAYTVVTVAHCSDGQTAPTVNVRAGSLVRHRHP